MAADTAISAVLAVKNDIVTFTAAAKPLHDTSICYLDVSTMDGSKVIFLVQRDTEATNNPTIKVTDGAEFSAGAVGNLTQLTTLGGEYIIGPLETSRFKDSNGYINVYQSTDDSIVMGIRAILLP